MELNNVRLIGEANVYFDGKVSSRTFYEDGQRKTLGFVLAGEYVFSTDGAEHMQILNGCLELKLPGEASFSLYEKGDTFTIPAQTTFDIRTNTFGDYCCTYL